MVRRLPRGRGAVVGSAVAAMAIGFVCMLLPSALLQTIGIASMSGVVLGACLAAFFNDIRLAARPAPGYCRNCRYDMRGLDGGRCPECGAVCHAL